MSIVARTCRGMSSLPIPELLLAIIGAKARLKCRIELVQWPAGHADGITKADFA